MYIFKSSIVLLTLFLLTACGGGDSSKDDRKGDVQDVQLETKTDKKDPTKPIIKLNGLETYYLKLNDTYIDKGATAKDISGVDLTSSITVTPQTIDTSVTGKQTITYSVTDAEGKLTTKKRKIIINNIVNSGKGVHVNEFLTANTYNGIDPDFGQFSDWIELYNYNDTDINIGGYHISDDKNLPEKYTIPNTNIPAHGYIIIWADKKNIKTNNIHANFKLSSKEDSIIFTDVGGNIIDDITYIKQKSDISASFKDGAMNYYNPTFKSKNITPKTTSKTSKKPKFSLDSGFYNGTQTVTLTQKNNGAIYYTTDGSIPTKNSALYTSPITLNKTTVIKTRAAEDGKFLSSIKNHTYLINENITLPVMSVTIDEKYLYGKDGIYTNFTETWMRPGSVEFIKDGKTQFSKNVGIKIHGNNTRRYPQKSIALYSDKKFDSKSIKYQLFVDKPNIKKVKSFVLRSGGTDWGRLLMRDGMQHKIVKDTMDIDYQSYEPVVMFLNGKYWGIHAIREKMNADYLADNHNIDTKKIDFLEDNAQVKEGNSVDYLALTNFANTHDLTIDTNYNEVVSKIDLTEYMNYIITESFFGNSSIHHNIKYWKETKEGSKWRWLLFDLDRGFRSISNIPLGYVADEDETSIIFKNLLKNKKFDTLFASRYFTFLNTVFKTDRMDKIITDIKDKVEPEITRHFNKWTQDDLNQSVSYNTWKEYLRKVYIFSKERKNTVIPALRTDLNLVGSPILHISKANNGDVYIHGVKLNQSYDGQYFNGAKVTLKAIPIDGYKFVKWSDGQTSPEISVILNNDTSIEANFQ